MKNREKWKEAAAALLIVFSFWNILYPEFSLAEDAYRRTVSAEEAGGGERTVREDYDAILNAGDGEVEIRIGFLGKSVRRSSKVAKDTA